MALALDKVSVVRQYLYSKQHIPSVRIAVLGCEGVGKRSLLQRFCYGSLIEQTRTSMMELEWHKHVAVQGRDVHIQFDLMNDGSLQQAQSNLLEYIQNNEAFMLVYDVTDQESFEVLRQICQLYSEIPHQRPWHAVPFFIVAAKIDRWRGGWAVPYRVGDEFANSVGATFLPMSALNGEGTQDAVMVDVVSRVLLSRFQNDGDPEPRSFPKIQIPASKELPSLPKHSSSLASVGQVTRLAETKTKRTPLGSDNSTSKTPSRENGLPPLASPTVVLLIATLESKVDTKSEP
ncbi:hypothetical protein CBER1_02922 [Cercospora berteroae]|uniref:small monomeric GTPase n=1 Tax=Cercospora berteroae TaxID=357750 RepID=A0A2S6BQJ0_9PEZI|nr:hypothetical protein CBER1_02922 [Cercospora berteroae]